MQNKKPEKGKALSITTKPGGKAAGKTRHAQSAYVKAQRGVAPSGRKKGKKGKKSWWAGPVVALTMIILVGMGYLGLTEVRNYLSFVAMRNAVERQAFYPGVTVDGRDLSGVTLEQALSLWGEEENQRTGNMQVALRLGDKNWLLTPADAGYASDYQTVLRQAYEQGRSGSLEERYREVNRIASEGASYSTKSGLDERALRERTDAIAKELTQAAKDATVKSFNADELSFRFTEGASGTKVDADQLYQQVASAFSSGGSQVVEIEQKVVQPKVTASDLQASFGLVASATTSASSSSSNRLTNIKLAMKAFDGMRLDPGETFSFNGVVGKRTTDKGYKAAGAISNGIMIQDTGGGICQVSTTLFNAVAKADLEVVERSPHSRPSSYVDLGKDAAVNWPNQDFKFKNNTDMPIYLVAKLNSKKQLVISVYGKKLENGMTIKITSKQTATIKPGKDRTIADKDLAPGERVLVEKARNGKKAVAYKHYIDKNGNTIKTVELCKSTYPASGNVYKVGK